MAFLRLPSTLRWILVACLIMLLFMTVYRLVLLVIFAESSNQEAAIVLGGLLQDAGIVSMIGLLVTTLSWVPALHPYKHRKGKLVLLVVFSVAAAILASVYLFDLIFLKSLDERVNADVFALIGGASKKHFAILRRNFTVMPVILLILLMVWMWWILLSWLHNVLGTLGRAEEKSIRMLWKGIFIAAFTGFALITLISPGPVSRNDLKIKGSEIRPLKWNPMQTIGKS